MIFSIVVLLLVFGIAYFHWVQGLFSGIISVVLAVLAASLAVGYHESVVTGLMGGKVADSANALMMAVIFALVYGVGRVLFDSLIPGNVRLPLYLDAVGGGVCGLIVGIFAVGMFAYSAQTMPFGPSIVGFSRFPIAEVRDVTVNGARRQETAQVTGALEDDRPDEAAAESKETGLMLGVDSMLLNFVAYQSESGALAGSTPLRERHPNALREAFFQRLGIEPSAKHSALNIAGRSDVTLDAIFAPASLPQMDGMDPALNRNRKLPPLLKSDPAKVLLVIRVSATKGAAETDNRVRFSPGMVRFVSNGKDYYPTGTIYEAGRANLLMSNRMDDYLIAALDAAAGKATIDLVFLIDRTDALADAAAKDDLKVKPGAFLEFKRFARIDLTDKPIASTPPTAPDASGMMWQNGLTAAITARLAESAGGEKPAK